MKFLFAIDLGGTKTAIGLLDKKLKILEKEIFPTEAKKWRWVLDWEDD